MEKDHVKIETDEEFITLSGTQDIVITDEPEDLLIPPPQIRANVVEPKDLPPIWDEVAELLGPACERSFGQDTIQTLRASLMSGNEGLFIIEDGRDIIGAVTYEVINYDTGLRVMAINYAGGVAMDSQMPAVITCSTHSSGTSCATGWDHGP